jgi:hypothetical protein
MNASDRLTFPILKVCMNVFEHLMIFLYEDGLKTLRNDQKLSSKRTRRRSGMWMPITFKSERNNVLEHIVENVTAHVSKMK